MLRNVLNEGLFDAVVMSMLSFELFDDGNHQYE